MLTVKLTKNEFLKADKDYVIWLSSFSTDELSPKVNFIRQLRLRYRVENRIKGYITVSELWDFYLLTETKLWKELEC